MENLDKKREVTSELPPNVKTLSWVSFFNDVASEMIYPIVPIFLTSVLKTSIVSVGIIEGFAEATASLLKLFSGIYSDKIRRRKPFVIFGYSLSTLAKPVIGLATGPFGVLLGRLLDRTGKGIRTAPRDALISESVRKEDKGKAFGYHRAFDTMGAVVGPLIALLLVIVFKDNLRPIFFIATVPAIIGVLLLVFVLKEKSRDVTVTEKKVIQKLSFKNLPTSFKLFLATSFIFAIGNSSDAFLILRSKDLGFSTTEAIFAYVLFNIVYAGFSYGAGKLSDGIGSKKILFVGFAVFALVYGTFGLTHTASLLWILFPVYGLYMAFTDGVGKAFVARLIPQEALGSAFGLYQGVTGIATLFASIIAGFVWSIYGAEYVFIFGAVTATLALVSLLFIQEKNHLI